MASSTGTLKDWLGERFELKRGGAANNLLPMEGLRGLAVFVVFLSHYGSLIRPWVTEHAGLHSLTFRLIPLGGSGVDLFFVLSGFLIYGSLIGRPRPFVPYFRRRLVRLYPAFIVVFVAYVALSLVFQEQNKIPSGWGPATAYLVANFAMLPGIFPIEPMITVAWSLSYEIAYYLAIPVVITLLRLRSWSRSARVGLFLALTALAFPLFTVLGGPMRLTSFIAGILLFEQLAARPKSGPGAALAWIALLAAFASTQCTLGGDIGYTTRIALLFVLFYLVTWSALGRQDSAFARALCYTPLRWLGNMSYSYYLMHALALHSGLMVVARFAPYEVQGPAFFFGVLPLMFVWTLIPSAALYLLVERPFSLAAGAKKAKAAAATSAA